VNHLNIFKYIRNKIKDPTAFSAESQPWPILPRRQKRIAAHGTSQVPWPKQPTNGLTAPCTGRGHCPATTGVTARWRHPHVAPERRLEHQHRAVDLPQQRNKGEGSAHTDAMAARRRENTQRRRSGWPGILDGGSRATRFCAPRCLGRGGGE
jgi:hypothetical protein